MDGTTYVYGEDRHTSLAASIRWMVLRMCALLERYDRISYVNNTSPNTLLAIVRSMGGDPGATTALLKAIDYQRIESVRDIVQVPGDVVVVENLQTVLASSYHLEYNEVNYVLTKIMKRPGQVYVMDVEANEFVRHLVDTEVVVERAASPPPPDTGEAAAGTSAVGAGATTTQNTAGAGAADHHVSGAASHPQ